MNFPELLLVRILKVICEEGIKPSTNIEDKLGFVVSILIRDHDPHAPRCFSGATVGKCL